MPKSKLPAAALASLLMVGLLVGMSYFAGLMAPSSFPEMSSLNTGPKGTKLLFDALSSMRPLRVSRNYLPFNQWKPSSSAILILSLTAFTLNSSSKEDLIEVETLIRSKNRVVVCIPDDSTVGKFEAKKPPLVKTRWGMQIGNKDKKLFLDSDSSWQPVSGLADAVEKRFVHGGSVVVALHSADLSNKSLATDSNVLSEVPPLIGRTHLSFLMRRIWGLKNLVALPPSCAAIGYKA